MKNKLTIIALLGSIMLGTASFAGVNESKKGGGEVFNETAILLNFGGGIPSFQTPYANSFAIPKLSLALEFGVHKWISVGGFMALNYWASSGENAFWKWEQLQPDFLAGAKGSFHFSAIGNEKWNWNINTEKVDIYASAFVGAGVYAWTKRETDKSNGNVYTSTGSSPYPVIGASVGIRYFISPTFGFYGEAGYTPLGLINGGFSFKFR